MFSIMKSIIPSVNKKVLFSARAVLFLARRGAQAIGGPAPTARIGRAFDNPFDTPCGMTDTKGGLGPYRTPGGTAR